MSERIIPIIAHTARLPLPQGSPTEANGLLQDKLLRPCKDLRISITDRCNFRCVYCMPRVVFNKDYPFLPHSSLLTFEEITRLSQLLVAHGVTKIRLTGGEPLLRKNIEKLVAMLRQISTPDATPLDLTLTTNGTLLTQKAQQLADAGLNRLTVSLDALDDRVFKQMNDANFSVGEVIKGLEMAHKVGLGPIKINMVVKKGVNDHQIIPMARYFKHSPFILRFIEYMDVGSSNGWKMDEVVTSDSIIEQINHASDDLQLIPIASNYQGETAQRWRYKDGVGEIGVISSVSHAFCQDCTRLRLSTDGKLYTCLFATQGQDIRQLLRSGADDAHIGQVIGQIWRARGDRYSEIRHQQTQAIDKIEMSYIGG